MPGTIVITVVLLLGLGFLAGRNGRIQQYALLFTVIAVVLGAVMDGPDPITLFFTGLYSFIYSLIFFWLLHSFSSKVILYFPVMVIGSVVWLVLPVLINRAF